MPRPAEGALFTLSLAPYKLSKRSGFVLLLPKPSTYFQVCLINGVAGIFSYFLCRDRESNSCLFSCTSLSDRIRKYCCSFGGYLLVKLFFQIISRWCRSEWGEQLDQHLVFLFLNILMTSVDDSMTLFAPDQRIKLEQIQLQHITLMHRYLKSTCRKKANSKLADTLMMLQYAKELNRLHSLRLPF